MMKAVDIRGGKGEKEDMYINAETVMPSPGLGQILVRVKAFGINRMDISQRRGGYPVPPQAPKTLGVEFSGVITRLGPGECRDFKMDDEVFGLAYGGAYAEYIVVGANLLMHKPVSLSFTQSAAIPEAWFTATQALHSVLEFAPGKSILWHAGASGVSIAGIQLSKAAGASAIFTTAGTRAKCDFVTSSSVGATLAINYKEQDFVEEIKKSTSGKGVDYIVDYIGGPYFQRNLDVASRDCSIVMLGRMGGMTVPEADISPILAKRIRIEGSTLRSRDEHYQGKLRAQLEKKLHKFETGEFNVVIDTILSWEQVAEAHRRIEESENCGKIVCVIDW